MSFLISLYPACISLTRSDAQSRLTDSDAASRSSESKVSKSDASAKSVGVSLVLRVSHMPPAAGVWCT